MGEDCSTCNFLKAENHEFSTETQKPYYKSSVHGQHKLGGDSQTMVTSGTPDGNKNGTNNEAKAGLMIQKRLKGIIARSKVAKMKQTKAAKKKVKELIADSSPSTAVVHEPKKDDAAVEERSKNRVFETTSDYASKRLQLNVTVKCEDGAVYKGDLFDNKKNGKGTIEWPNGARYEGEWKDDLFNGKGILHAPNGATIDGQWVDGKLNGAAKYELPNGEVIEGEFLDDLPHGKIKHKKPDGTLYEGMCEKGKRNGAGVLVWADGRKYEGNFKDDDMDGYGILCGKDGTIYQGDFDKGKKHGNGTYTWKDGRSYTGPFLNGKQHGIGKYTAKGVTKTGKWNNGTREAWIDEETGNATNDS